jgi:hypothetical protein
MPKKKPVPLKKKVQEPHRSFTPAERDGVDTTALISRLNYEGKRHKLLNTISELTNCPFFAIPDKDVLTVPILEEIIEKLNGSKAKTRKNS